MSQVQSSRVRNEPDIQGSLYDVYHCYHDEGQAEGIAKMWNQPSSKEDKVVCCWCGKKRFKFRIEVMKGHGPFTPQSLTLDLQENEECPGSKG